MTELKPCPRCQGTGSVEASSLGSPEHEAARAVPRVDGDDGEQPAPYRCKHGCERDELIDRITALSAEVAEKDAALWDAIALIGHRMKMDETALVAGEILVARQVWEAGKAALGAKP